MKHPISTYSNGKNNRKKRPIKVLLLILVILAVLGGAYAVKHHTKKSTSGKATGSSSPIDSKGTPQSTVTTTPSSTPTKDGSDATTPSTTPTTTSTDPPKTPYGSFVSNHNPRLTDSEQSTCTSTPGATCDISYSKDGVTKKLGEKKTDADGTAYWTWNVGSIGLTEGKWHITATATLNGKSTSADDTLGLMVSQ